VKINVELWWNRSDGGKQEQSGKLTAVPLSTVHIAGSGMGQRPRLRGEGLTADGLSQGTVSLKFISVFSPYRAVNNSPSLLQKPVG